jgi:hypothetical protein
MNSLLGIKNAKDIQWRSQPSKEAVDAFANRTGPGPNLVPMQLALGYKKNEPWNVTMGEQFFDDFLDREEARLKIKENEWPIIYEKFWQRFTNLRKEWKQWQPKSGEDAHAVSHRNSQRIKKTHKVTRRDARRNYVSE